MISNSVQLNLQLNQNIENLIEITPTELQYIETSVEEQRNRQLEQILYMYKCFLILKFHYRLFLIVSH